MFGAYSGGAHCCMQSITVTPIAGRLVTGELGTSDGDGIPIEDLDGDGAYEVLLSDDRFDYSFDAYAFSSAPTLVYRFKDGVPYDASGEPQFIPFIEEELAQNAAGCTGDVEWYQGQCAAMVANAARLGRYAEYFDPMAKALAEGKTMASGWTDFDFCEGAECKFTSFVEALPFALKLWGYLED